MTTMMTGSDKETLVAAADLLKRVADRLRAVASTLPGDKPLRAEIAALERAAKRVLAVAEGWPVA